MVHAPFFESDPERDGTRTEVFICVSFTRKILLIGGSKYAGEVKKSVFSVMNYLLPLQGIASMHCSANVGEGGDVAIFFGLSGTGKTTLSADPKRALIGDDEHGWDDEGIPAQSTTIVKDGLFVGYLMSRETASQLGKESNGCMRASGWDRTPLIRMTNVSLESGDWDFEDMIADTDQGIFMDTNRSWSIDDKRYNFQFGTEIGYEIKNGKLGRMLRNPTYTGITPRFWNSCDAVAGSKHWQMYGTPNCGKGQPGQIAHTGHGAAPARFRDVKVGVI